MAWASKIVIYYKSLSGHWVLKYDGGMVVVWTRCGHFLNLQHWIVQPNQCNNKSSSTSAFEHKITPPSTLCLHSMKTIMCVQSRQIIHYIQYNTEALEFILEYFYMKMNSFDILRGAIFFIFDCMYGCSFNLKNLHVKFEVICSAFNTCIMLNVTLCTSYL